MQDLNQFLTRAHVLLDRLEQILPNSAPLSVPAGSVLRWRAMGARRHLVAATLPTRTQLAELQCIDRQKQLLDRNTRQFLAGLPANHGLLWGPRGTGKSCLIRAIFNNYQNRGLRLVEVAREHLADLHDICAALATTPDRFLLFCDDLSFSAGDDAYRALKSMVDGSASGLPDNVLIYATSNRRHLVPEYMQENLDSGIQDGELHLSEAVEEKLSLSERFGIWVSFHPFTQDQYLRIVSYWVKQFAPEVEYQGETMQRAALQWALERGSRSGRSAWQFARDWAGQRQLESP